MAEISNMYNSNRINLGERIPLDSPLVIQLEPSGFCNLECSFCPCGNSETRKFIQKDMMSLACFEKFIDQCKTFKDRIKVLRLIGIGEPLLNKNIGTFVKIAKESGAFDRVEITSNGVLLTHEVADQLIDAGLDTLLISLESNDEIKFEKIAGRKVSLDTMKEQFQYFYKRKSNTKFYIKTTNLGVENNSDFYNEYGEFCDYIYVENVIENWPEFDAGSNQGAVRYEEVPYQKKKEICIQPFKLLCVAANGDVVPCCVDWKRDLLLGNINDQSILEIWNGDRLKQLRKSLLQNQKKNICNRCSYSVQNQPDDIDAYADEILKRLD